MGALCCKVGVVKYLPLPPQKRNFFCKSVFIKPRSVALANPHF